MNAQEVFDKVATHLLTQNAKSMTTGAGRACAYRGDNGTMCAAGCLIPDDKYKPEYEYNTICSLKNKFPETLEFWGEHFELAHKLQTVHDAYLVENWKEQLNAVAQLYDLSPKVILKFN